MYCMLWAAHSGSPYHAKASAYGCTYIAYKMAAIVQLSSCLPDIVVAYIQAAASTGKKLSWTLKEDTRGVLVHLVWKHSKNGSESVCTKWKPRTISPSRQKRNCMRLLKFLSSEQESLSGQLSDARTHVSASTEPVDAADAVLVASGHTPF